MDLCILLLVGLHFKGNEDKVPEFGKNHRYLYELRKVYTHKSSNSIEKWLILFFQVKDYLFELVPSLIASHIDDNLLSVASLPGKVDCQG